VTGVLSSLDGEQTGKIKMTFRMEVINELAKQQLSSPVSSTSIGVEPILPPAFPCFITIRAVRAIEIPLKDSDGLNSRPLSAVGGRATSVSVVNTRPVSLTLRLHCDGYYQSVEVNYLVAYCWFFLPRLVFQGSNHRW
jgi:hypothetical protein